MIKNIQGYSLLTVVIVAVVVSLIVSLATVSLTGNAITGKAFVPSKEPSGVLYVDEVSGNIGIGTVPQVRLDSQNSNSGQEKIRFWNQAY